MTIANNAPEDKGKALKGMISISPSGWWAKALRRGHRLPKTVSLKMGRLGHADPLEEHGCQNCSMWRLCFLHEDPSSSNAAGRDVSDRCQGDWEQSESSNCFAPFYHMLHSVFSTQTSQCEFLKEKKAIKAIHKSCQAHWQPCNLYIAMKMGMFGE